MSYLFLLAYPSTHTDKEILSVQPTHHRASKDIFSYLLGNHLTYNSCFDIDTDFLNFPPTPELASAERMLTRNNRWLQ